MKNLQLFGIETEYGLSVKDRSPKTQVADAKEFLKACPFQHSDKWNYQFESPRKDLRGFTHRQLSLDPLDATFDQENTTSHSQQRIDRILTNGARFYNDHGHPEYSTPECNAIYEVAVHDKAGEFILSQTASAYQKASGHSVQIYKNNTDYHGASYGTHENYLISRNTAYARLYEALIPMLVVRQILCGAGKVGAESGKPCTYQLSQRADFLETLASIDTLYKRPIFNTRDEPHADPTKYIRLHIICGDANRIFSATKRKIALTQIALTLLQNDTYPIWKIENPVDAFQQISRDQTLEFSVALENNQYATAPEILESYFSAYQKQIKDPNCELIACIEECRELLKALPQDFEKFSRSVDWAAKKQMITKYVTTQKTTWEDPFLQALDLEYHLIDPNQSLYNALLEINEVDREPPTTEILKRIDTVLEPNRAAVRAQAIQHFPDHLASISWGTITFSKNGELLPITLDPTQKYQEELLNISDVDTFINALEVKS